MPKKVFILAGEASADLQGAFLVREIKKNKTDVVFSGVGGCRMREEGVNIFQDTSSIGVIGPWNAIPKMPLMIKMFNQVKRELISFKPDLTILIDSPAANMRMGRFARENGFKTLYYFPPSAWYACTERVCKISQVADYIVPVFEYNTRTYTKAGLPFYYFGHPLVDIVAEKLACSGSRKDCFPPDKINIAFLPGSRLQEIDSLMPAFVGTMKLMASQRNNLHFLIPVAFPHVKQRISKYLKSDPGISFSLVDGGAYEVLKYSRAAVMASGSATLEASIAGVPMVVVYKLAWPDWIIGKMFINVPFFALPNLVVQKKIVPELLQTEVNPERLAKELFEITDDTDKRTRMIADLQDVRRSLGESGVIKSVSSLICDILDNNI